jgi:ankyrin repeat protein
VDLVSTWLKGYKQGLDSADCMGRTELHYAVHFNIGTTGGGPETTKLLLSAGASPLHEDNNGDSPILIAAKEGHGVETLRLLMERGESRGWLPVPLIPTAITHGCSKEMVNFLMDRGESLNCEDHQGRSALFAAIGRYADGHKWLTFVLERGARADYATSDGTTAFHYLAQRGLLQLREIADILRKHGACVHATRLPTKEEELAGESEGITVLRELHLREKKFMLGEGEELRGLLRIWVSEE